LLEVTYVKQAARGARQLLFSNLRQARHTDRRLVEDYLTQATVRKLHLGCGTNVLPGWLNADYFPSSAKILHLDATKPFSLLAIGSFDYIFSEHMIEHISYLDGSRMIAECYRILRLGGKLRLSTPDLSFLVDLYKNDKSKMQREYVDWASKRITWAPYNEDTFVINNFVRDWGHCFIYDEKTLRKSMGKSGFTGITRYPLALSDDQAFCKLENEKKMPAGFLQLESLTLEGSKS
jgi:predicted SAM-dependent methyltransferase